MIEGMPRRTLVACFVCGEGALAQEAVTDETTGEPRYAHVGCYGFQRLVVEITRPEAQEGD